MVNVVVVNVVVEVAVTVVVVVVTVVVVSRQTWHSTGQESRSKPPSLASAQRCALSDVQMGWESLCSAQTGSGAVVPPWLVVVGATVGSQLPHSRGHRAGTTDGNRLHISVSSSLHSISSTRLAQGSTVVTVVANFGVVDVLLQDKHCSGQTFRISGMTRHRKSGNSAHALGSLRPLQFASVVVTVVAVEVGPGACVVVVVLTQASHITGQISAMYLPAIMFEQRVEFKSGQISTGSGLPLHFSTHLLQRAGHRCWMARPAEPRVQSRSTNATRQSRNGSSSP